MAGGLLASPLAAEAQPGGRPARIGWLSSGSRARGPEEWRPGFERHRGQSGWNPRFELRYAERDQNRLAEMAGGMVGSGIDVIVATDTAPALAAKRATSRLPIVICGLSDPVGSGVVAALARPGANVTGTSSGFDDGVAGKWVELLREVRPISSLAVIWNPDSPQGVPRLNEIDRVAKTLTLPVRRLGIRSPADADVVVEVLERDSTGGVIIDADLTLLPYMPRFIDAADSTEFHRLPPGDRRRRQACSWHSGPVSQTSTISRRSMWTGFYAERNRPTLPSNGCQSKSW